jgi:hypothetical protein
MTDQLENPFCYGCASNNLILKDSTIIKCSITPEKRGLKCPCGICLVKSVCEEVCAPLECYLSLTEQCNYETR